MKKHVLMLLLLLPSWSFGLGVYPNTIVHNIDLMQRLNWAFDTVCLKNETNSAVVIDSITILFLNGDSARDFIACRDCDPAQFTQYIYNGWICGTTHTSLRYMRDSLFLLQDSIGRPIILSINPNDSAFFYIHVITNCPYCGRMPSFPNTTKYRYSFHVSGNVSVNLIVRLNDTITTSIRYSFKRNDSNTLNTDAAIEASMQSDGSVFLKAFDIIGHEIGTIVQGEHKSAAKRLSKGVYYYTITSGSNRKTHKIMLVK